MAGVKIISIHALREEGDLPPFLTQLSNGQFLSTPSARRATRARSLAARDRAISIHALREEGDRGPVHLFRIGRVISIHALREEGDLGIGGQLSEEEQFLSTPSARRATVFVSPESSPGRNFYPRPPRGGRLALYCWMAPRAYFYPRPPRGGRRPAGWRIYRRCGISIHALREEGD